MGLTFTVGNARHVFVEPYGSNLDRALTGHAESVETTDVTPAEAARRIAVQLLRQPPN
jgi:hypothetical protein